MTKYALVCYRARSSAIGGYANVNVRAIAQQLTANQFLIVDWRVVGLPKKSVRSQMGKIKYRSSLDFVFPEWFSDLEEFNEDS